jgi:hypothetical protein
MAITPEERQITTYVFLFIVLLTAVAAVAANLGLFGLDPNSNFAKTTLLAVLVEIVAAVIIVWRTTTLEETSVSAVIELPAGMDPDQVDWDANGCFYELRDIQAEVKSKQKLSVVFGHAGWECKIPRPNNLDDSVTFTLTEKNGTTWEVRPFYPLSRTVVAVKQ